MEQPKLAKPVAQSRSKGLPTAREALGQREKNKIEKLRRIKDATYELFSTKGYDETTTREIALRAGVGLGTVFLYADNKRDLLFLIANDDLEAAVQKAEDSILSEQPFRDALLSIFRPHFAFFAHQPALSRLMLREMTFYDSGSQAARFKDARERLLKLICRVVAMAKKQGSIKSTRADADIAWVLFCIYQVELRRWLGQGKPSVSRGLASLTSSLDLCIEGLASKPRS